MSGVKLVIIGDGAVGKTCMLLTYVHGGKFPTGYVPTIFDNFDCLVDVDDVPTPLSLCDTAGQEDYDRLRKLAYPGTDIFVVVYDCNKLSSLENVRDQWVPELRRACPQAPFILVGNKSDVANNRNGDIAAHAARMASELGGIEALACSAVTGDGLTAVFNTAISVALAHKRGAPGRNRGRSTAAALSSRISRAYKSGAAAARQSRSSKSARRSTAPRRRSESYRVSVQSSRSRASSFPASVRRSSRAVKNGDSWLSANRHVAALLACMVFMGLCALIGYATASADTTSGDVASKTAEFSDAAGSEADDNQRKGNKIKVVEVVREGNNNTFLYVFLVAALAAAGLTYYAWSRRKGTREGKDDTTEVTAMETGRKGSAQDGFVGTVNTVGSQRASSASSSSSVSGSSTSTAYSSARNTQSLQVVSNSRYTAAFPSAGPPPSAKPAARGSSRVISKKKKEEEAAVSNSRYTTPTPAAHDIAGGKKKRRASTRRSTRQPHVVSNARYTQRPGTRSVIRAREAVVSNSRYTCNQTGGAAGTVPVRRRSSRRLSLSTARRRQSSSTMMMSHHGGCGGGGNVQVFSVHRGVSIPRRNDK